MGGSEEATSKGGLLLSGRADLNRRPHGPEPCALTKLRYAPHGGHHTTKGVSGKHLVGGRSFFFLLIEPCVAYGIISNGVLGRIPLV